MADDRLLAVPQALADLLADATPASAAEFKPVFRQLNGALAEILRRLSRIEAAIQLRLDDSDESPTSH
jgi:hypothetical protein